jgi:6-phosphogluconolactonase
MIKRSNYHHFLEPETPMTYTIYIGTYTRSQPGEEHRKEGIFMYCMDPVTGSLEKVMGVEGGQNPSFLAIHPSGKFLYVANETLDSYASAFKIDPQDGKPVFLNQDVTRGAHACYVSLDPSGRWLLLSNYSSGSLAVLPIKEDGRLGPLTDLAQHQGRGPNIERQETAHAHSIRFDPSGNYALAADLGIDKILVYRLDFEKGKLIPNEPPFVNSKPGAGPRHMVFHQNERILYVANELDSTVSSYAWDPDKGELKPLETISTLPDEFSGENTVADIHLTPSGEYLYVSNRGHNSLTAYQVDPQSGSLALIGIFPCSGDWPRNFAIDPQGKFLLVANQYSNNLVVFMIETNGVLTETGVMVEVPAPVCVQFA